MDRIPLKAEERTVLGKKVKQLRQQGFIPGHVFGHGLDTEHVLVKFNEFNKVYRQTGETGLIDLKIGQEKIRPVMVRDMQIDPLKGVPLHIDFYQVNLNVAVQVTVPIEVIGEDSEIVHTGEAVVIQPLSEVEVEALPGHIPDSIQVDKTSLQQIDDAIMVSQLSVPAEVKVLTDPEAVIIKLDTAVVEEPVEEVVTEEAEGAEGTEEGAEGEETREEGSGTSETGEAQQENPQG